jgi:signal transduction histidine kinase
MIVRHSLLLPLVATFAVCVFLVTTISGWNELRNEQAELTRAVEDVCNFSAERLGIELVDPYWNMDQQQIDTLVSVELKNPNLTGVLILNEQGKPVRFFQRSANGVHRATSDTLGMGKVSQNALLHSEQSLQLKGEEIGRVVVFAGVEILRPKLALEWRKFLLNTGAIFLASLIGFLVFLRLVRRDRIHDWKKTTLNALNALVRGEQSPETIANKVMSFLPEVFKVGSGALYLNRERQGELYPVATYACSLGDLNGFKQGEGLLGQAVKSKVPVYLESIPAEFRFIRSALGSARPSFLIVVPLVHHSTVLGALELACFRKMGEEELDLLSSVSEVVAVTFGVANSRRQIDELLETSQAQTEELTAQQQELVYANAELEERTSLLSQQREEIEQVSRYKSEFLANMSHELRTPLNSMLILSEILQKNREGTLTPKQVEYATTINGAGKDLLFLINDVLDLSKVEAGKVKVSLERCRLSSVIVNLEKLFQPIAERNNNRFRTFLDPALQDFEYLDEKLLLQILKNLLANAFKFTKNGTVDLSVSVSKGTVDQLEFSVQDSGIGIPEGKQTMIFEAFEQADGTTSRKYGGTGLGLSISLKLARQMGGDIFLSSKPGAGAKFTLVLPRKMETSRTVVPMNQNLNQVIIPLLRGKTILVVDDDMRNVFAVASVLSGYGMNVIESANGREALQRLDSTPGIDLVLMEVLLPEIDGYSAMRSIRNQPRFQEIPLIAMATKAHPESKELCMQAGANEFLAKPLDFSKLIAILQVWIKP